MLFHDSRKGLSSSQDHKFAQTDPGINKVQQRVHKDETTHNIVSFITTTVFHFIKRPSSTKGQGRIIINY